ncbi:ATP-binding protein [Calothrix sp. PCC 6303]|uniref:GAF domain-containing sensor histidine kinase n=1 Tax=Calothrix sp. PCC 6303 TaxID=1170562 RepID=UPI0002A0180C|nr:ATP-binding protein [Calothrix sp. PCC 6303]AFZ00802.1 histidine kinase [Calothrix sp. PCC 6303]
MLISASSEFVALCREQMALLAQGLGASLSIVYLTQELMETQADEAKLIPVLVYPETPESSQGKLKSSDFPQLGTITADISVKGLRFAAQNKLALPHLHQRLLTSGEDLVLVPETSSPMSQEEYLSIGKQIVLPLLNEDRVVGVLVTARDDRAWNEQEQREIERIAQTLAIACILDRQRTWLQQQLHQQQIFQEKQLDLLDNLLHQFRNPLTALRTFGKLLLKRLRAGEANREVATSIVRESDRLQELLQKFDEAIDLTGEDLIPLLRSQTEVVVEASVQPLKPKLLLPGSDEIETDCDLMEVLQPLLDSAYAIAQERNLELITEFPLKLPLVRINHKSLREVISNILDNSLKYTPNGGKVLVQTGLEKPGFQGIAISDNGPGIPQQDIKHLGERHYRGVQAATQIPGTGLGLAIAKQLLEQMQGNLEVFSPAFNSTIKSSKTVGTTFIIWVREIIS